MRGKDLTQFVIILILSLVFGFMIYDVEYNNYSDLITFLSIMIGFKITSLSILFSSPLKRTLFDRKIKRYMTELHRLRDYYRHSLLFETLSIVAIFVIPKQMGSFILWETTVVIGRYLLVFPVLLGTIFCFYKITHDLLKIFVYPTNEKSH